MHILMIPSWYPDSEHPQNGSFFREQAEMLLAAGNQVSVLVVSGTTSVKKYLTPATVSSEDGIKVVRISALLLPRGLRLAEQPLLERVVEMGYQALGIDRPDIIHAHSVLPGVLAAEFLSNQMRVPYVFTEHRPSSIRTQNGDIRKRRISRAVKQARVRMTVSRGFAHVLNKYYGVSDFEFLPLPVPDIFFTEPLADRKKQPFTFIHASHLAPVKCVPHLIEAFAGIENYPNSRLRIVGGTREKIEELRRLTRRLGVAERVDLIGSVGRPALAQLMADSDCFVLNSEYESGGAVLSEAHATGLPIIVTNTWGGKNHSEYDSVDLVSVGNVPELRHAMIRQVQGSSTLKSGYREKIRNTAVSRFHPDIYTREQSMIYRRAINSAPRKAMVFHAPYPLEENVTTGSRVRPTNMLKAFNDLGYEVIEITGNPKDRAASFRDLKKRIRQGDKVDFAYSENSTQPNLLATSLKVGFAPLLEARIFSYLRLRRVPFGQFYRDVYWRFPESLEGVPDWRKRVMRLLYRFDLLVLRVVRAHLFLPSEKMGSVVPVSATRSSALPPGCIIKNSESPEGLKLFYVGSLGAHYGLHKCFQAVHEVDNVELTACVPKLAWAQNKHEYLPFMNDRIKIVHRASDELEPFYDDASIAVLFVEPSEYRTFATPIKFFEYLGHGKPIIASRGTNAGEMVENYSIGWTIDYDAEAFASLLRKLLADPKELREMTARSHVERENQTWVKRAEKAATVLTKGRI